jgi:hypothetical protein
MQNADAFKRNSVQIEIVESVDSISNSLVYMFLFSLTFAQWLPTSLEYCHLPFNLIHAVYVVRILHLAHLHLNKGDFL